MEKTARVGLMLLFGGFCSAPTAAQQRTYANPLDVDYRYNWEQRYEGVSYRTGADPAVVRHKDAYYLFLTLADGYWRSTDLIHWSFIAPSRWPTEGIVAPAAISNGERLILWPSMNRLSLCAHALSATSTPMSARPIWRSATSVCSATRTAQLRRGRRTSLHHATRISATR